MIPKKLGKQRLIFDTRHANQHFRRPWHCALPTPASWAGLQLPVGSTYHVAQTDVSVHSTTPARCGCSRSFAAFA